MVAEFAAEAPTGPFAVGHVHLFGAPDLKALGARPLAALLGEYAVKRKGLAGQYASAADIKADLAKLDSTGLFGKIKVYHKRQADGTTDLCFVAIQQKLGRAPNDVLFVNDTCLPPDLKKRIKQRLLQADYLTPALVGWAVQSVQGFYREGEMPFNQLESVSGVGTDCVSFKVKEGLIKSLTFKNSGPADEDNPDEEPPLLVPTGMIEEEIPLQPGRVYNYKDATKTLRKLYGSEIFDSVNIQPFFGGEDPNTTTPGDDSLRLEVLLQEKPVKTGDINLDWSLAPGRNGRPGLVSVVPAAEFFLEHRNVDGKGGQASVSVITPNLLSMSEDLAYQLSYVRPFLPSVLMPAKKFGRKFVASAFNYRKQSGVFTGNAAVAEDAVPPVWVARRGLRSGFSENYSCNSKGSAALVLQQVQAADENGNPCVRGGRGLADGSIAMDGPPTTLGASGTDYLASVQGTLVRDATYSEGVTTLGKRDILEVNQGLFCGTTFPFFNRHTLSSTRFFPLAPDSWTKHQKEGAKPRSRPSLVLHGKYGGCIGDLPTYEAFTLGGPNSIRGFKVGEVATCRAFAEAAAEVRVPLFQKTLYGFAEYGSDLGSSKHVAGNPSAVYRREGQGASFGGGLKVGIVRFEYAKNCNTGEGNWYAMFGDRF